MSNGALSPPLPLEARHPPQNESVAVPTGKA